MVEVLDKNRFRVLPWKNGGGVTSELYVLPGVNGEFLFRLSVAQVDSDGPWSNFSGVDRILLLLDGAGFSLKRENEKTTIVENKLKPLSFSGEEPIYCSLLDGACRDFNVMTRRNYATSLISIISSTTAHSINLTAECDLKFIYDIHAERLITMEKGDTYLLEASTTSVFLVVDVTILAK